MLVCRDVSERKQLEQTLEHMAMHDPLTDLPNRKLYDVELRRARARAERVRKRALVRRVLARRASIRRNKRLRREGREVCFMRDGRRVCRVPRPVVCLKRASDGRTICRARRR